MMQRFHHKLQTMDHGHFSPLHWSTMSSMGKAWPAGEHDVEAHVLKPALVGRIHRRKETITMTHPEAVKTKQSGLETLGGSDFGRHSRITQ
jgi:O-succinylbenzoate synthase